MVGVEDESAEVVAREVDCEGEGEDSVIAVRPVVVGTELEELAVVAITVLSGVDVTLLLTVVLVTAEHCPACAQYWPMAQHIGPHNVSPNPLLQFNDVAAAAAVEGVCVELELVSRAEHCPA